jgi:hypothetical protein
MSSRQQIPFDPTWKPGFGSRIKNLLLGKNRNKLHARAPPPNNNTARRYRNNNTTRRYRNNRAKGRARGTRLIRLSPLTEGIKTMSAELWNGLRKADQNSYYLNERTGKYKMYQDVIDEMEYGPYINGNNRAPNIAMPLPLPRGRAGHNRLQVALQPTLTVSEYEELGHGSNPRYNLQGMYTPVYSEGYASGFGGATSPVILSYTLTPPNIAMPVARGRAVHSRLQPRLTVSEYQELGHGSNPRYNLQGMYRPIYSEGYANPFGGGSATSSIITHYELKQ